MELVPGSAWPWEHVPKPGARAGFWGCWRCPRTPAVTQHRACGLLNAVTAVTTVAAARCSLCPKDTGGSQEALAPVLAHPGYPLILFYCSFIRRSVCPRGRCPDGVLPPAASTSVFSTAQWNWQGRFHPPRAASTCREVLGTVTRVTSDEPTSLLPAQPPLLRVCWGVWTTSRSSEEYSLCVCDSSKSLMEKRP